MKIDIYYIPAHYFVNKIVSIRKKKNTTTIQRLEKEMATHSSIFAWKVPRMEKLGGLQLMGSQRVGHD